MRVLLVAVFALTLAAARIVSAAPPRPNSAAPASAPTTRMVRRRVVVVPTTQRASLPVPPTASQEDLRKKIHEIYTTDYADTSFNGRRALARRLIDASDQTQHDHDAKFVLLHEARDVAASAGDVTTAFDAVDHLTTEFQLSRLAERLAVMKAAVNSLASSHADLAAASICVDLADQCVVEAGYQDAETLLNLATSATRQAKSVPYAKWINAKLAALRPLKDAYEVARPAESTLMLSPNDPEANLIMGRFVAFIKGDTDSGLTMLGKGSNPDLASAAELDLDNPESATAQFQLAGKWWELAERQMPEYRPMMRARAGFWYRKSLPGLDGLDKALAQRRLLELNPPATRPVRPEHPPDVLKLTDHWYRVSIAEVSWETAQRLCNEAGGQLVCIETRGEGELMAKLAHGRPLWLGATCDSNGKWTWLSGAEFLHSNWAPGEPSGRTTTTEPHPLMSSNGVWRAGTGKAGFICEWKE